MVWLIFVAGAVLSWGAYGVLLAQGQTQLGNPLKALLCVGVAYFLIGVIVPDIRDSDLANLCEGLDGRFRRDARARGLAAGPNTKRGGSTGEGSGSRRR